MKSERRHELQTNTLAHWINRQSENVKPHVNLILTVVLAAVAVVLAWVYFREWNASRSTAAWSDFYAAADSSDAAALAEMAERHAGEPASLWATLLAADIQLEMGAGQTFTDRRQAESSLKNALTGYEAVLNDDVHGREPLLRRRAMFGLAEAHEALFAVTGDKTHLEAARQTYGKVADAWPDTVLGRSAEQKQAGLATQDAEDFLAWFSEQEPISQEIPAMGEGPGSAGSPFDMTTLPGAEEMLLPEEAPIAPVGPDITSPAGDDDEPVVPAVPETNAPEEPVEPATEDAAPPSEPAEEPPGGPQAADDAAESEPQP
ncbi:MAG: hypothetical protein KY475_24760 [Planctomycetes bacterium]|nr:hypothetical protein [Planctomycetota bacterium]